MVARLQRLLVAVLFGVGLVLGWQFTRVAVQPGWGVWLGLTLVVAPHAPVLAVEFLLLACFGRDPKVVVASGMQMLRAWWAELWCVWRVFGWQQPFGAQRWPDVCGRPGRRGVVLIHGFFCNRGLWNLWLQRLSALGVPCIAPTLEPAFGSIDGYARAIDAAVMALYRQTGREPVLVAHSMGGLAVRAWLCGRVNQTDAQPPVHAVVTVGTPHHGTWLARFGLSTNARQMRTGSPWLRALAERERCQAQQRQASGQPGPRFVCFYGHADNIVFPASQGCLAGAENRHLSGAAHVQMLFRPEVWAAVSVLQAEPPGQSLGPAE